MLSASGQRWGLSAAPRQTSALPSSGFPASRQRVKIAARFCLSTGQSCQESAACRANDKCSRRFYELTRREGAKKIAPRNCAVTRGHGRRGPRGACFSLGLGAVATLARGFLRAKRLRSPARREQVVGMIWRVTGICWRRRRTVHSAARPRARERRLPHRRQSTSRRGQRAWPIPNGRLGAGCAVSAERLRAAVRREGRKKAPARRAAVRRRIAGLAIAAWPLGAPLRARHEPTDLREAERQSPRRGESGAEPPSR